MFNEPIINEGKTILSLEGCANDLYKVRKCVHIKSVGLMYLGEIDPKVQVEVQLPSIDVTITSVDLVSTNHPVIDSMLGKKIRITVELID